MNLNSKNTQNIIIIGLFLALVTTFSVEAMQINKDNNESIAIKEKPPIKNSLKDYIVEEVDVIQEIENETDIIVEEVIDEDIEDITPEYIPEDQVEYDSSLDDDTNIPPVTPPSEDTGSDIPDGNLPGTGDKPTPPPSTGDGGTGGDDITKPDVPDNGGNPETPEPPQPPTEGEGEGSTPEVPEEDNENETPELP